MQIVILVAGEGTRMLPLTLATPKPMLRVAGKPLLEHLFDNLPADIDEVIIVVRYLGEQIKDYFGSIFRGRPITYAEGSPLGTAYSFLAAAPHLKDGRFLCAYGDELPCKEDMVSLLRHPASILCWEEPEPWKHGVVSLRPDGSIERIIEKPSNSPTNLIAGGVMVLNTKILKYQPRLGPKGEYYFSNMIDQFVSEEYVMAVSSVRAIGGISTPADLARVEAWLKEQKEKTGNPNSL